MDPVGLGDGPAALAGLQPLESLFLLVVVQLGLAAELCAALDGGLPTFVGA
jgi:hypothetical protein